MSAGPSLRESPALAALAERASDGVSVVGGFGVLLGNIVVLAPHDFSETANRVRQLHIFAGKSCELLGYMKRLS